MEIVGEEEEVVGEGGSGKRHLFVVSGSLVFGTYVAYCILLYINTSLSARPVRSQADFSGDVRTIQ